MLLECNNIVITTLITIAQDVGRGHKSGEELFRQETAVEQFGGAPRVCRVRAPQTKGKVERLVRYVKENFFPGRRFGDLEDLKMISTPGRSSVSQWS